ncbi:hypothetical protein ACROYT_G027645 [Oculina patagonica]
MKVMATNDEPRGIQPFDCRGDSTSAGLGWRRWRKSFQFYVDGRGITVAARKKALLLYCAGMEVQDIFETLTDPGTPEGEDDNFYKAALRTLDAYFTPQMNEPYERHMFRQMKQEENETVDQLVVRLSNEAANCEVGTSKNEQIRDQIIDKCKSTELRRNILAKGQELTLTKTQKIARFLEVSQTQAKQIEGDAVCKTNQEQKKKNKRKQDGREKVNCMEDGEGNDYAFAVGSGDSCHRSGSETVDLQVGSVILSGVLIDSGSSCNIIDQNTWKQVKLKGLKCKSEKTNQKLYPYGTLEPLY